MEELLNKAIEIATDAHKGQLDKAGNEYINHPLRVMNLVNTGDEKIVAILHDVVEKTDVTFDDLSKSGIPDTLINSIKLLTHNPDVPYFDYIRNLAHDPIAKKVKLADLKDNYQMVSKMSITEESRKLLEKYDKATDILLLIRNP